MKGNIIKERPGYQKFLFVFFLYFTAGIGAEYLFYSLNTQPTLLWIPTGIALGLIIIWGYEQWFPIALAQLFIILANPIHAGPAFIALDVVAYTGQAVIGAFVLKKLNFNGIIAGARDVILLVGVGFIVPAIAPAALIGISILVHASGVSFWSEWSRAWVGGITGTLLVTPLITTWFYSPRRDFINLGPQRWSEAFIMSAFVAITTYLLFWTTIFGAGNIVLLYVLFAVFFWIGFRFRPRVLMFEFFFMAALGIAGTIVAHPAATSINTQLFSDELFFILIAPIFLFMGVLVTERKLAVLQLQDEKRELAGAMAKLSDLDRSKNEFISIFAHELRNPLAPIASTLEYLQLNEADPENRKMVEVAHQQVRLVRRLLDDLLDVARIAQNKFRLQKEVAALETVVQPAVASVGAFFESRNHTFRFDYTETNGVMIDMDPARIMQAVVNVLFNAGKYTPLGGAIELTTAREGDTALIVVKDNGVGISKEMLALIFEPFQQAGRPLTEQVGAGLGLGLFITKQIVELHGGTIQAASEGTNQGTTFTIRLPIVRHIPEKPLISGEPFAFGPPGHPLRILVVDDNMAAAEALQKLLTLRGHTVRVAHDAKDALASMQKDVPEVVILDIGLPDMDGYQLAREIKKGGVKAHLIALTGYGQDEDRAKSASAGFEYHITKPVGLTDLEKVFAKIRPIEEVSA